MPTLARRRIESPTSASVTHANNPFNQFPKLDRVKVRKPSKKDRLTLLRAQRDSLKSGNLTPEQLLNRMIFYPNLNLFQAVELAEKEGRPLIPNIVHDKVLTKTGARYSSWTGTLVVYEAPDKPFGESVTFSWSDKDVSHSLSFQIPEEHRGRINCTLVIEHPDFTFVKLMENTYEVKLTEGAVVHLAEGFPARNGGYSQNELGIPYGSPETKSPEKRYLWRNKSGYIGLLVRYIGLGRYSVNVACEVSVHLQMALII